MFLSLLRGAMVVSKCQAMDKKRSRKPCMLGWPLPPLSSLQMYLTNYDAERDKNKIPKCFSCPGDCKELSKKTKRSTYDSNQAMADPTADLRQQLANHEADKDKRGECTLWPVNFKELKIEEIFYEVQNPCRIFLRNF